MTGMAGRKRVALLCLRYPPALGGVEMVVQAQAEILREHYAVTVLTTDLLNHKLMRHGAGPAREEHDGLTICRLPCWSPLGICYPYAPAMAGLLADWQPDVVHAHSLWYYPLWCAWQHARRHRVPFILQPHFDPKTHWFIRAYRRMFLRGVMAQATVATISGHEEATLRHDGWVWPAAVRLPNPVAGAALAAAPPAPVLPNELMVLYVGRLDRAKGVVELVRAFATVAAALPAARLWLVGQDGDALPEVRRLTDECRLADRIVIAPEIGADRQRLYGAYRAAAVFVMPSHAESFGMAVAEATAAGAAVVATDIPALREQITDGEHGLLVPVAAADQLAAALLRVLRDRELARRLGQAARERVLARCDLPVYRQRLLDLYRQVLA